MKQKRNKNDIEMMVKFFEFFDRYCTVGEPNKVYSIVSKRFRRCRAIVYEVSSLRTGELLYIVLQSYNTVVAVLDIRANIVEIRGRYSITTYKHIVKFMNDYNCSECDNWELENWFK